MHNRSELLQSAGAESFPFAVMEEHDPLQWLLEQAEQAYINKAWDRATPIYEKMLTLARGRASVQQFCHLRLASIHTLRRDVAKLKRHYLSAITLDPDNAPLRYELGETLHRMGRQREAVACFRAAVERAPQEPTYQIKYAVCLHQAGRDQEAEMMFRKALSLDPTNVGLLRSFGLCLMDRELLDEAELVLQKALQLSPDDKELLSTFSLLQFSRRKAAPKPVPVPKKEELTHVVRGEAHWVEEDDDRREAYENYRLQRRTDALSFSDWRGFDDELLELLFASSLRDLAGHEEKRLQTLQALLIL